MKTVPDLDIVGVAGSIPAAPTKVFKYFNMLRFTRVLIKVNGRRHLARTHHEHARSARAKCVQVLAVCSLLLAGPALAESFPEWDALGHRYPAECRQGLSHIKAAVIMLPEAAIKARFEALARPLVAAGVMRGGKAPAALYGFVSFAFPITIYINGEMSRYMVDPAKVDRLIPEIIRHERCHIQIKAVTGSPIWHP